MVTSALAPVFWKRGAQALIATSTAESELQTLTERSLAAKNIRKLLKEIEGLPKEIKEKDLTIKEWGRTGKNSTIMKKTKMKRTMKFVALTIKLLRRRCCRKAVPGGPDISESVYQL